MSSLRHGKNTLKAEVTHISPHGIWLLSSTGKELFMPYEQFPWFKDQPIRIIHKVKEPSSGHFYWPDIDMDLSENIIENPSHYPHIASHTRQKRSDT